jgi:hypothetical protein
MGSVLDESELLVAFARAASKAQQIEALFQDLLIAAEVAQDKDNRSLDQIERQIESETLGQLKGRFLRVVQTALDDPLHTRMWKEINDERIFLMHKFFTVFPLPISNPEMMEQATQRLIKIDKLLDIGCGMLSTVRDLTFKSVNIPPERMREFLAFVIERRSTATGDSDKPK